MLRRWYNLGPRLMMCWTVNAAALRFDFLDRTASFKGAHALEGALALTSNLLVNRPHLLQVFTTALLRLAAESAAAESTEGRLQLLFNVQLTLHDRVVS